MSGHGSPAALSIVTRQPDGSIVLRRWYVCPCIADQLTAQLGEPAVEALADADAVSHIMSRSAGLEGLVITTREQP
ncbi:hypothetical protein [Nonomuraea sp. KM90]|uniref:hypothetical protein n=1 Tax=Nonomuraea sp. KM90 TaxID=3457428 RepID=UPI003FCC989B